ncbi:hypothetical protein V6N13_028164 [Hibiscus sabdariffa]|uniref:BRX domain-containing protein n=1 Tax=Hibiscus sabdariffa TaxID=183260 RepID=A0ABR2DB85_9ROSI
MATNKTFYTDSNGRDFIKRGSSLAYGQIELMLHRRLIHDDVRGVGEVLNETVCVAEGYHREFYLRIDHIWEGAKWRRTVGQEIYSPLLLAFSEQDGDDWMSSHIPTFSGIDPFYSLPDNIAIITLQELENGKVLLWLAHLYETREDKDNSAMASVELKKLLPAPVSRRTSRATSPASGKLSTRSSTVTIDDSKQMDDNINREIIYLREKVEDLTGKSRHLEVKLEQTSRKLKQVTAIAENEAEKYKSAEEVIKSLNEKLEQVTNMLPSGQNGLYNAGSIAKHTSNIEHVFHNNNRATSMMSTPSEVCCNANNRATSMMSTPSEVSCNANNRATSMMSTPSEVTCNANNLSTPNGTKEQTKGSETMIQAEPGVYITLLHLPDGCNALKRVRFSRKHFTQENAEKRWAANKA